VVANLLEMQKQAQKWMQRATHGRHMIKLTLPPSQSHLEAGDSLVLKHDKTRYTYRIESIEEGEKREIDAVLIPDQEIQSQQSSLRKGPQIAPAAIAQSSKPVVEILDLPLLPDKPDRPHAPYVAIHAKPWPLAMQIYEGTAQSGFSLKQTLDMPAIMGRLSQPLVEAKPDHWFEAQDSDVTLLSGELASVSQNQLLAGANAAAIKAKNGQWEIIQFQKADLIGPRRWRLRRLLRGQLGTEQAAMAGAEQNARFILLDDAVK
ncbi:MAG: phage tail protein, partial [Cohaesibacter sp.]|nr:phage tail protein [Cohaesibacter sp.]